MRNSQMAHGNTCMVFFQANNANHERWVSNEFFLLRLAMRLI